MKFAVSGKGGVGKTTLSANLAFQMRDKGYNVFAIDADPDLSLGTVLGLSEQEIEELQPIVEMRELILERTQGDGSMYILNPDVDDVWQDYSIDVNGIRFLKMGAVKKRGCYCLENTFLNALINSIVIKAKDAVLLDMGAGIEHLTRGTVRGIDCLIIVVEPSVVSTDTAKVTRGLAEEIGIKNIYYVGNKIRNEKEIEFLKTRVPAENILGCIGYNDYLLDQAMGMADEEGEDKARFDRDIAAILKSIEDRHGDA
ncbi:MAG: AAA family ATPase [Firmicutes bacterium]|nr:AAA family ATPase [Bacillota bacterium]